MAPCHSLKHIAHEIGAAAIEQHFAKFMDRQFQSASDRMFCDDFAPDFSVGLERHGSQFRGADRAQWLRAMGLPFPLPLRQQLG